MKVTINPSGGLGFEPTLTDFKDVFSWIFHKDPEKKFEAIFNEIKNNRGKQALFAKQYYQNAKVCLLGGYIPLIEGDNWIPDIPIPINDVILNYEDNKRKIKIDYSALPYRKENYVSNIIKVLYGGNEDKSPYVDNFCYCLKKVNSVDSLSFDKCTYFDYINSCEFAMYNFIASFCMKDGEKNNIRLLELERSFDPFDFNNRYMVAGINTLLVFLDKDNSYFYLHKRSKNNLAEAINTKNVVPAGTFQPSHYDDSYHEYDFNLYVNIMREFGEELHGDKEAILPIGTREKILERKSISRFDYLISRGMARVYYAGVTLDCLTLKPEILTVMVFKAEDFLRLFGGINHKENYEGKPYAIKFSKEMLQKYSNDIDVLPAGAGCLYLANKNYDFILNCLN